MADSRHIVLACAADDRFGMPLAVMLRSACDHLAGEWRLSATVIDGGLAPWTKRRILRSLDRRRVEVDWIRADARRVAGLKVTGHIRVASYFRLLVPDLVPSPRAIYLDCDVVVESDLGALWQVDLGGRSVAAAQDMSTPWVSSRYGLANWRELGLAETDAYFNAGVLVMDLDRWRAERIGDAALAYVRANPDRVRFWDQDALNVILARRWLALDPRWNVTMQVGVPILDEHRDAVASPFVTHYPSRRKPWHVGCEHPRRDAFFRFLDRTDWAGWRPSDSIGRRLRGRAERLAGRLYETFAGLRRK